MTNAKPGQPRGTAVALGNEAQRSMRSKEMATPRLSMPERWSPGLRKHDALTPGRAVSFGHLGEAYFDLAWVERTLGQWDRAAADSDRAMSYWRSIDSS
jgi:hypothetical protein